MLKNWQKIKQDPKLLTQFLIRGQIINLVRDFFIQHNFLEIETPLLTPSLPAESYLEIFETQLLDRNRRAKKAYLTTSPEIFLKKLLAAGIGNCFTITKSFRNTETSSNLHNPEFTILEWYRVNADYKDVMKDTEELIMSVYNKITQGHPELTGYRHPEPALPVKDLPNNSEKILRFAQNDNVVLQNDKKPKLTYQNQTIDLSTPWEKITVSQAFKKYCNMDLEKNLSLEEIKITAKNKGYNFDKSTTWEELYNQIYLNEIEKHLGKGKPTIIYDFPSSMGALAKKKPTDPRFCERFEIYIAGLELGDCYSELTDWKEQEERFKKEIKEIKRLGKTVYPYDQDFINALKSGLPNCSGLAMGIDRLIMLFADKTDISDVMFFPASQLWES